MSNILDDLQNFEFIQPYGNFKPQGPISRIEIQPVKRDDDGNCEPCAIGEERFWSVYVRYDPKKSSHGFGGVDCVADCSGYDGALKLANLLGALLGVEVVQP